LSTSRVAETEHGLGIRWVHNGDTCEAIVGGPIRWARLVKTPRGRVVAWREEGRVVDIDRNLGWRVHFDRGLGSVSRRWSNPVLCGDDVEWITEYTR
jgi:hypothetical protein